MSFTCKEPKLRFPAFRAEWEEKKIGNILKIGSGKDYKHLENGDIPVYGTGGYMLSVNEYLYDGESVCIGRKGTIDKPVLLSGKFWTVDTLFYTHSFNESIPKFVYAIFQRINWKEHNEASGVPSLSKNTIESIKINIPSKPEQEKIASFLTVVDAKIEQLTCKDKLLQKYKKSAMQKLFSQELRFKADDGSEYPEWEEKKLEEVTQSIKNGLSLNQNTENNGYKVTRIETISDTTININKVGYATTNLDISNYKLEIGDMLFSNINSVKHIGKIAYVDKDYDLYHGMNLLNIKVNQINNNSKFIYYLLTSEKYKNHFETICNQAVSQASINQTDLKKVKLFLPQIDEQTKIANFLSAIDEKCLHVKHQLEQTKQFKKALLQQMFV